MPMHASIPRAYLRLDVAAEPRRVGVGRVVRDVDRRHPRGVVLRRRACSACALGPNTRPDYGLVVGRAKACTVAHARRPARGVRRRRRDARDRAARRCASACCGRAQPVLDVDHRRAFPRLDAAAGVRPRCARAASGPRRSRSHRGEPVYGLGEKFGPLDKRGQLDPFAGRRRARRQHRPRVQEHAVRVEPGQRQRRVGRVRPHAGHGDARRRPSRLVAPQLRGGGRGRGARPLPVRRPTRRPAIIDALHAAHRTRAARCRAGASGCGCRARTTRRRSEAVDVAAKLRERKIPCDVLTLDGRAAWDVETRFDFEWDPERFPDPRGGARRDQGARPARLRLGIPVRVGAFAAVPGAGAARLPARRRRTATPYVFGWDTTPGDEPVRQRADAAAGKRHRRLHAIPARSRGGATRTSRCSTHGVDVDQERFRRARSRRRASRSTATAAGACTTSIRCSTTSACSRRPRKFQPPRRRAADGLGPRRLDGQPALSDRLGRRSAKRLGRPRRVDPRRAVVGHERRAVSQLPTSAASTARRSRRAELYVRWLQAAVFSSHMRVHGIGEREPWAFGAEAEAIARKWLAFRYRLIPVSRSA